MDMIFNELSVYPLKENPFLGDQRMRLLINKCGIGQQHDFRKLRVRPDFTQLEIAPNYSIDNWLNDNVSGTFKTLLLGLIKFPYIPNDETELVDDFILSSFVLNEPDHPKNGHEAEGLSVAFLSETISISFQSHPIWDKCHIRLIREFNGQKNEVFVQNRGLNNCFEVEDVEEPPTQFLRNENRFISTSRISRLGTTIFLEIETRNYWYFDNFHRNHFEVFNNQGDHLGEADLEGNLDVTRAIPQRTIRNILR